MGLEDELAAEAGLVVGDDDLESHPGEFDGGGQARGTAAHDEDVGGETALRGAGSGLVVCGKDGKAVEAPHVHAGLEGGHAGLAREAVHDDRALGALAIGAEDALGGAVLRVTGKGHDAGRGEGRGKGFAGTATAGRAVEPEFHHSFRLWLAHDGVACDAVHVYAPIADLDTVKGASTGRMRLLLRPVSVSLDETTLR